MTRISSQVMTDVESGDGDSISGMVSQLCELIIREQLPTLSSKDLQLRVKHARSQAYSILLGKTVIQDNSEKEEFEKMSPVCSLIAYSYKLHCCGDIEKSSELDECIKKACDNGWDEEPLPILQTLVSLADNSKPVIAIPPYGPFHPEKILQTPDTLGSSKNTSVPEYPTFSLDVFRPPAWMNIHRSFLSSRAYPTNFPFDKLPGEGLQLLQQFCSNTHRTSWHKDKAPPQPLYQLPTIRPLTGPRELTFPEPAQQCSHLDDEGYVTPMTDVAKNESDVNVVSSGRMEDPTRIWSDALHVKLPQLHSWESLGVLDPKPEPPFLSAAPQEAIHQLSDVRILYTNLMSTSASVPVKDVQPTSKDVFVRDVFYLLIGIESQIFHYVKKGDRFILRPGLWLEGYTTESTLSLCQDFLDCGTYFKRLDKLSHSEKIQAETGLMVHTLKASVRRFTVFYRGAVLALSTRVRSPNKPILLYELLNQVKSLKLKVECVARLCHVEGAVSDSEPLPRGASLLTHLYQELCRSMRREQTCLLYSVFKSCCEVYLRCLERWIFTGKCSDVDHEEFFVQADLQFLAKRNRFYWTRGFVLNTAAVPDFLQGLEVAIYECGRAVNLLRLCSPQHPLCVLLEKKHPAVHCYLHKSDLEIVEEDCSVFEEEARKVCGEQMSVTRQLEEEHEHERRLQVLMVKVEQERAVKRAEEKARVARERAKRQQRQLEELKAQILEAKQRKIDEEERRQAEDAKYLEEYQRLEEEAKQLHEEERQKLIAHYEELNAHIKERENHADWQLRRFKLSEKRAQFICEDQAKLLDELDHFETDLVKEVSKSIPHSSLKTSGDQTSGCAADDADKIPSEKFVDLTSSQFTTDSPSRPEAECQNEDFTNKKGSSGVEHAHLTPIEKSIQESGGVSNISKASLRCEGGGTENVSAVEETNRCGNSWSRKSNQDNISENPCLSVSSAVTDRCKNKQRVLGSKIVWGEFDSSTEVQNLHKQSVSSESQIAYADTERDKNRRRVMETEFNILTGRLVNYQHPDTALTKEKPSENLTEAGRNRRRVLEEEFDLRVKGTKPSFKEADGHKVGALTDLERNRRRVLGEEFGVFSSRSFNTGPSLSAIVPSVKGSSDISDMERNRRKVLGEEYDILTGERMLPYIKLSSDEADGVTDLGKNLVTASTEEALREELEHNSARPVQGVAVAQIFSERDNARDVDDALTKSPSPKLSSVAGDIVMSTDSGIGTQDGSKETCSVVSQEENSTLKRPDMLKLCSVSSDTRNFLQTPLSALDEPTFSSTFHYPMLLSSPVGPVKLLQVPCQSQQRNFPLMVDIMDRFTAYPHSDEAPVEPEKPDMSEVSPNSSWLGPALHQCLVGPLQVQHRLVSSALLHYFLVDLGLLSHFQSLRSYYFMLDGEFGRHLTSQLFAQMYQVSTPAGLLNGFTLNSLLHVALESSRSSVDPNRSRLSFCVTDTPHHFKHYSPNALDCLHLCYSALWPLNLLFTEEALGKYNVIFVFLVRLRRVAWLLQEDFTVLKSTARHCFKEQRRDLLNSPQYHQVQMIRHCMSQFVQATLNYVSSGVLHASWTDFETDLKQATTLDHIYSAHIAYIKRLLKRCLLNQNSKRVEAVLTKILACILQFHSQMRVRAWQVPSNPTNIQYSRRTHLEHPFFSKLVSTFQQFKLQVCKLVSYLERLIAPPNQQQHLAEYLLLLNLNGFYAASDYLKRVENTADSAAK